MSSQATTIKLDDDEQATPINQLQNNQQQNNQQQNNNVVNDIMNSYQDMEADDMEDNPEEVYQRQMMNDVNEPQQEQEYDDEYEEEQENQYQQVQPKKTNQTMLSKLLDSIKPSLVVVVLFFALNQTVIINMMCSLIQTTMGEECNYNMYGLILRSIIAGALFYATSYFV